MGAIAVLFHRTDQPVERPAVERMAGALRAYGPDGVTCEVAGSVGYGHARMILTPEDRTDRQPVSAAAGRFRVLFEGRLDNRDDLLPLLPVERDAPDSVLAAECWARWGDGAVERWIGPYTAIVVDRAERCVTALRSPSGQRVLHYHLRADRVVFASSPHALFALGDIPCIPDRQKIADALSFFPADAARSYFEAVQRIRPGEMMTVTPDTVRQTVFYRLEDRVREVRLPSDDDYVEAAREHLDRAVTAQLRSARPVGSLMSGGFDSSSMAVVAAAKQGALTTYTSVPDPAWHGKTSPGAYGDETPHINAIASMEPRLSPVFVDAAGLGLYYALDARVRAMAMPVRNALNAYWLHAIMGRVKAAGTRVLLDGTMGNLTLSYHGNDVVASLWRQRRFGQVMREFQCSGRGVGGMARMAVAQVLVPLGPDALWRWHRGRHRPGPEPLRAITSDFAAETGMKQRIAAHRADYAGHPEGRMGHHRACQRIMTQHIAPEIGDIIQGFMAQHGVELRDPFNHQPLVEWSMGVPEDQFQRGGQPKWLIKRAMAGRLPDSVLYKRIPMGRQTPDWYLRLSRDRERIRADLDTMANDAQIAGMIDVPMLQQAVRDWPDEDALTPGDPRTAILSFILPHALQVARLIQLFRA